MGKKLSRKDNELYKSTDEVLHYIWDPIGVSGSPYARDEYWAYLSQVFSMLKNNECKENIVNYLLSVEEENLGLRPNQKNAENTVDFLIEHKKKIDEENPNST
ncbi:MAG: hypothetical protein DWQ05_15020 [Calditrichaeota bacterium]|nr:MAG: hypothetical protein DWQ05_15020 [Calditrichota bacterium]